MSFVRHGVLPDAEMIDPGADQYGGGVIRRSAFAAAAQVIHPYAGMRYLGDVTEDIFKGYMKDLPYTNFTPPFQYTRGRGYGGVLPVDQQPIIPRKNPWE